MAVIRGSTLLSSLPFLSYRMIMYPFCLSIALILINVMGGSIDLPITNNDAQRDFNTALGTSLISGYFLLTIRFVHRNLASSLYAILVIKNQQSLFKHYNKEIAQSFKRHVVWCVSIGFLMPVVYMVSEGVIERINEPEVIVVAITAIPFWFLMSLFFIEVYASNKLLRKLTCSHELSASSQIELIRKVLNVGLTSATIILSGTALMPIFWINQPVHFFDLLFISCLLGFVALFLMWPLFTLIFKLNSLSEKVFEENENLISNYIKSNNAKVESSFIEKKITEQELYAHALTPSHYKKLITCIIPLPFSWLLFLLIESILVV